MFLSRIPINRTPEKTRIEENSALSKSQLSHDKLHKNQKVVHSFSTHIYDIHQDGRQGSPNMFSVLSICQNEIFFETIVDK